ncbi:MAG: 1-deoxy-D-xylulose-5-phosphate synthase [Methylacidiphilales bacterium]|nr:1-deoxy-D-xylulose-5-phosphate synthase [Candidatus Methylacidiphilales bacterium]MDW8350116.1 1-deoxy-D-xylulose-5-phosphate synthase [Verrucomicrobiae bacterium]
MSKLLDTINSPADLKKIPIPHLPTLAQEIREKLIYDLSKTGGHLGPNLGVVELTIALHYVFNTPTDNFVFDVSHQAYVHKLLTGRRDRFHTIRQPGGLNGFMLRTESEHDCYGAGHAGTALSAALGMAVGRDHRGTQEHIIALCGDAAFTCGITFEALNNVAHHTRRLIIILNDNEWSIDKNVGAIANYFNRIATNPGIASLHDRARKFLERIGGKLAARALHKAEEAVKGMVFPSLLFEEFGVTYYGPIDGHDIPTLIKTFEFLKEQDYPVLLHVLTTKSKGFEPALEKQKKFHGLGPFDPETGETLPSSQPTYSEIFADTLVRLANDDPTIIAITGAMPNGTGLDRFSPKHPSKYYDVGIAEEHAVIFAAGLATKGLKPFCAIYSTFLQRAFDPIVHDVCLQNLHVVFCMDRAGLSGDDGPTHHGLFDIAYLRGIPNIVLMAPKDEEEFADMLATAAAHNGPIAIRYPRGIGPGAKPKEKLTPIPIGQAEIIHDGNDVAILALGDLFNMGAQTRIELEKQGYSTALINPRFIKPLDQKTLEHYARRCRLIITFEDHVLKNGFGTAVLETLSDLQLPTPVIRIGWPDQFIEHGKVPALRQKYGISVASALEKAITILKK